MSTSNPLVTFVLFSYNQEKYIREAIQGVFSQTYPNMEIFISDDCSSDRSFQIIEEMAAAYAGPHRVACFRNERNLGVAEHINRMNALANGELIVVAAADDISMPERTGRLVAEYLASGGTANYFYSTAREIGMDGAQMSIVSSPGAGDAGSVLAAALSPYPLAIGATQAWTKLLTLSFSALSPNIWAEDQILGFRGVLLGPVCGIDEPLVYYRVGSGVSTRKRKFSVRRYFNGKRDGIRIYRQRCADAWHVDRYLLSARIAAKVFFLTLTMPLSPLFSLGRKLGK